MTSRGDESDFKASKRHYALFCRSDRSLLENQTLEVYFDELCNASSRKALGYSQVTALVRHTRLHRNAEETGRKYSVPFKADLFGPYCVRLVNGAQMPSSLADQIAEVARQATPAEWSVFVRSLRADAMNKTHESVLPLFEGNSNLVKSSMLSI